MPGGREVFTLENLILAAIRNFGSKKGSFASPNIVRGGPSFSVIQLRRRFIWLFIITSYLHFRVYVSVDILRSELILLNRFN